MATPSDGRYHRFPPLPYLRGLLERNGWSAVAEMGVPSYIHANPLARWFAWRKVELAAEWVGGASLGTVLDFGCGAGTMLQHLNAVAEVAYACDVETSVARQVCADHGLDRVVLLSGQDSLEGVAAGSLDVIVALEVLEHVDELENVRDTFARLLRASGRLIVSVPTENWCYRIGRRIAGFRPGFHVRGASAVDACLAERFSMMRRRYLPPLLHLYEVVEYVL